MADTLMNELTKRLVLAGVDRKDAEARIKDRGLTSVDVDWNAKLGRPPQFKEGDSAVEAQRRTEYNRRTKDVVDAQPLIIPA